MEEDVVVRKPGERAMRDFRCPRAEHPRADVERVHLSVAGLVYAVGAHQRFANDSAAVSDLLHLGVHGRLGDQVLTGSASSLLRGVQRDGSRGRRLRNAGRDCFLS
jgi:hypothetical protein